MTRQHTTGRHLGLEVGFEPRRGGQEFLEDAYQRLLPPLSRLVPARSSTLFMEVRDATTRESTETDAVRRSRPRGDLRPSIL